MLLPPCQIDHTFMVEIDMQKRSYLAKHFPETILFKDMADMGKMEAATHNGVYRAVPKAGQSQRSSAMSSF